MTPHPSEDSFATVLPRDLVQNLEAEGNVMMTLMPLNEESTTATRSLLLMSGVLESEDL